MQLFSSSERLNLGLGLLVVLGGGYYISRKILNSSKIKNRQSVYNQALKCNLNQISIKKQKDIIKQGEAYFHNRSVSIENVMAHFSDNSRPLVTFKGNKYDDYARISCESFNIIQRKYSKDAYSFYKVNVRDTLTNQNVLIPDVTFRDPNKSSQQTHFSSAYTRILTSASTLGIIGTLSLSADSTYMIEAKIIGCSLEDIGKFIDEEKFYNNFGIFIGGVIIVFGAGWIIKTSQDARKKRVPLQFSLLTTSKK